MEQSTRYSLVLTKRTGSEPASVVAVDTFVEYAGDHGLEQVKADLRWWVEYLVTTLEWKEL